MSELQDWYLANMGIVNYALREPLGDLPIAGEPDRDAEPERPARKDLRGREGEAVIEAIRSVLPEKKEIPQKPVEVLSDSEPEPLPTSVKEVRFDLACWHPVDDLLVINDLVGLGIVNPDEQQLLSNILLAIGRRPASAEQLVPEMLSWPGKSRDVSEQAARTMISMFLSSRITNRGVCWVLLMGDSARQYLDRVADQSVGDSVQLAGGATGLVLPSLAELLENPSLKRDVWVSIQHLAPNAHE